MPISRPLIILFYFYSSTAVAVFSWRGEDSVISVLFNVKDSQKMVSVWLVCSLLRMIIIHSKLHQQIIFLDFRLVLLKRRYCEHLLDSHINFSLVVDYTPPLFSYTAHSGNLISVRLLLAGINSETIRVYDN